MKKFVKGIIMKNILLITAMAMSSSAALAENVNAIVADRYKIIVEVEPYTKKECVTVNVPVYGNTTQQGDAAGGALLGMIIGGLIGKGVTGDDGGAAAGAVFGGLVGADKGAQPKSKQTIIGHKQENRCDNVTYYKDVERTVYDYSIITWTQNGVTYSETYTK